MTTVLRFPRMTPSKSKSLAESLLCEKVAGARVDTDGRLCVLHLSAPGEIDTSTLTVVVDRQKCRAP